MTRSTYGRRGATRDPGRRVLIICEDSETSVGYFEGIRQAPRLPSRRVQVSSPEFTDPRNIVREAIALRQEERHQKSWSEPNGDHAWAVFDGDEHIANNPKNWSEALVLGRDHGMGLAVTNPSFELWYLVHFQDQGAPIHRDEALRALRAHLPNYQKSHRLYPEILSDKTQTALERAEELARHAKSFNLPEHTNPCCHGVAALVRSLLELAKSR